MEATKRNNVSDYHAQGLAFAPLVSNSFGQFGPDLLRLAPSTPPTIISPPRSKQPPSSIQQ